MSYQQSTSHYRTNQRLRAAPTGMLLAAPVSVYEEDDQPVIRKAEGSLAHQTIIIPDVKVFEPLDTEATPQTLFPPRECTDHLGFQTVRFINTQDPTCMLVYTDGSCRRNGTPGATAGCALHFRPPGQTPYGHIYGVISFRLEDTGPDGNKTPHTSNRAELRAVIGILQMHWDSEEQKKLVIATDSQYVAKGATGWGKDWNRRDWRRSRGEPVLNRDLWEWLFQKLRDTQELGLEVSFWWIPCHLNTFAHAAAQEAADFTRTWR
ncbi:hypothetical protein H072_1240 [Dactylellina haptotyla CBS 200.50]|uniref:ribonuclease H n=1 Tax=Dactylellina haptotyla (strain CBS 200.50) TaxID=1284197 RepID=S8AUZ4_DACHA|nr:hypothetical protein H072_1240 [Dactylellina haptotyla CBS 200.50]